MALLLLSLAACEEGYLRECHGGSPEWQLKAVGSTHSSSLLSSEVGER